MRLWRAIVLLNLALGIGLLLGYLAWGRQVERLERELTLARQRGVFPGVEQTWLVRGVVRAVIPEINVVVLTHEDIPGFMPSMTMGFRAQSPGLLQGVEVGATVRFTIQGVPPNVVITGVAAEGAP